MGGSFVTVWSVPSRTVTLCFRFSWGITGGKFPDLNSPCFEIWIGIRIALRIALPFYIGAKFYFVCFLWQFSVKAPKMILAFIEIGIALNFDVRFLYCIGTATKSTSWSFHQNEITSLARPYPGSKSEVSFIVVLRMRWMFYWTWLQKTSPTLKCHDLDHPIRLRGLFAKLDRRKYCSSLQFLFRCLIGDKTSFVCR